MSDLIDRQAAIEAIKASRTIYNGTWGKGLAMAAERVRQLPSVQPDWGKPVGDGRPLADGEVIARLQDIKKQIGGSYAIERAIEMLEWLSSVQPTPCDVCRHNPPSSMDGKPCCICPAEGREPMSDLIDRQAAIDEIDEWIKAFLESGHRESAADACLIQDGIIQLPSAQPEIIACGDCKYWICHDRRCGYWNHGAKALDWCSYAERRGE